jgi:hypothetical protein
MQKISFKGTRVFTDEQLLKALAMKVGGSYTQQDLVDGWIPLGGAAAQRAKYNLDSTVKFAGNNSFQFDQFKGWGRMYAVQKVDGGGPGATTIVWRCRIEPGVSSGHGCEKVNGDGSPIVPKVSPGVRGDTRVMRPGRAGAAGPYKPRGNSQGSGAPSMPKVSPGVRGAARVIRLGKSGTGAW